MVELHLTKYCKKNCAREMRLPIGHFNSKMCEKVLKQMEMKLYAKYCAKKAPVVEAATNMNCIK